MPFNSKSPITCIPLKISGSFPDDVAAFMRDTKIVSRDLSETDDFFLEFVEGYMCFRERNAPAALCIDFTKGSLWHRFRFSQGREAVAQAVGIKKGVRPTVADATAGLGRDAFVLASSGCRVHMIERSPLVAVLLYDALRRAWSNPEIGEWVKERLSLEFNDSAEALLSLSFVPDVVYLDPMFPERKKSALVKKEMRFLQKLLGRDEDADRLLETALTIAGKKVVVKRPAHADPLAGRKPDAKITSGKNRFDIYFTGNAE